MRIVQLQAAKPFRDFMTVHEVAQSEGWTWALATEALGRLERLDWLLIEIQRSEVEMAAINASLQDTSARRWLLLTEMHTLSEAFYYIAFRTRQLLRSLPDFKDWDAAGVTFGRNLLIEHPSAALQVDASGSMHSSGAGMIFGIRVAGEKKDKGLHANAEEFRDKLLPKLHPYVAMAAHLKEAERNGCELRSVAERLLAEHNHHRRIGPSPLVAIRLEDLGFAVRPKTPYEPLPRRRSLPSRGHPRHAPLLSRDPDR
jgi:hypothetical protein